MAVALDEVIHQPVRLQIMSALFRNRQCSFTSLRDGLGLTAGNLASHAARLEKAGYVQAARTLSARGFEAIYRLTPLGTHAFRGYLLALQRMIAEHHEGLDLTEGSHRTAAES